MRDGVATQSSVALALAALVLGAFAASLLVWRPTDRAADDWTRACATTYPPPQTCERLP